MNRGAAPRTGVLVLPELGNRLFRALYDAYDLIMVDGVNMAVPKDGTIHLVSAGFFAGISVPSCPARCCCEPRAVARAHPRH